MVYNEDPCSPNNTDTLGSDDIAFAVYCGTVLSVICVICFVGNTLIIHGIVYYPSLRPVHNWFALSLAASDIMQGITMPLYFLNHASAVTTGPDFEGNWSLCELLMILVCSPQTVSACNLTSITVVRFLAIKKPLNFRQILEEKKVWVIAGICFNWVFGFMTATALYVTDPPPDGYCGICIMEMLYDPNIVLAFMTLNVVIPVAVMSTLYILSLHEIHKRRKFVHNMLCMANRPLAQRQSRMLRIVSALLGFYTVSWLPFLVYQGFAQYDDDFMYEHRYFRASSRLMYFSNVAVNVFIYAGRSNDFRVVFANDWRAIKRCCCCHAQPIRASPSSAVFAPYSNMRNSSSSTLCQAMSAVSLDTNLTQAVSAVSLDTNNIQAVSAVSLDTINTQAVSDVSLDTNNTQALSTVSQDTSQTQAASTVSLDTSQTQAVSSVSLDTNQNQVMVDQGPDSSRERLPEVTHM